MKLILCLGSKARDIVKRRMGCARQPIEEQSEDNNRPWGTRVFRNPAGVVVLGMPHPSRSKWSTPECDPSAMVNRWLSRPAELPVDQRPVTKPGIGNIGP